MTRKNVPPPLPRTLKTVYRRRSAPCIIHTIMVLFATRLSAQCTDARVNIVTEKLFKQFPALQASRMRPRREIAEAIKTCGLFRTKARDLKALRHDADY